MLSHLREMCCDLSKITNQLVIEVKRKYGSVVLHPQVAAGRKNAFSASSSSLEEFKSLQED